MTRRISPSGTFETVAGQPGLVGAMPGPLPGSICSGTGLAFDADDALYVDCGIADPLKIQFGA